MAKFDAFVRNGTAVTSSGSTKIGLAIKDGRIAVPGNDLVTPDKVIDATARFIVSGDDFFVASSAAPSGDTSTVIPFACQRRGQCVQDIVAAYHEAAVKAALD